MFRDDKQRNLVIKTLLGVVNSAHWWTEEGPTERGAELLSYIQQGGRGLFSTSGNDIAKIAMSIWEKSIRYNLLDMLMLFDKGNKDLVISLFAATSSNDPSVVDRWLNLNGELRNKVG